MPYLKQACVVALSVSGACARLGAQVVESPEVRGSQPSFHSVVGMSSYGRLDRAVFRLPPAAAPADPLESPAAMAAGTAVPDAGQFLINWDEKEKNRARQGAKDPRGSVIIPVDSWIYPELLRLYSMGFLDTAFLSLRPWTRLSVVHMLDVSEGAIVASDNDEAKEIFATVKRELAAETRPADAPHHGLVSGVESAYVGFRSVGGPTLRDSWHLGQSFINDYGRPYSSGFNTYNGLSALAEQGPFSFYVRGEFQHAPSYQGYSTAVASQLSLVDQIPYSGYNVPQSTIPAGTLPSQNNFRLLEATLSAHLLGHEFSIGKSDSWLGPGVGGAMAWSNNAEYMYAFHIDRVEPLYIPLISRLLGPTRYDFFVGSLKGHTDPNSPWADSAMISFSPTRNFQIGFQRTIIFGGEGHAPVTLHTFLKGFFNVSDTSLAEKFSRDDPGARFSSVTFSWRLPYLTRWVTLYTDSTTHDDVFPISAPRRAGWRPGIYLSHLPAAPKFDLRVEGVYTDYPTLRSVYGQASYFEQIQKQGYTNKGFIMGDWIGREGKGLQGWLNYHLSGNETLTLAYANKKTAKDFIAGGTTQNTFRIDVVKRLGRDIELKLFVQEERWKAPIYLPGQQHDTTGSLQLTWFPQTR